MTDKELMQQALSALEGADQIDIDMRDAIVALKARLEQPAIAPEWVGLTDDEIKGIIGSWGDTPIKGYTRKLFDQIETKLKEKNNG
jgi:polyribonucleotide nucleotidyltransferase